MSRTIVRESEHTRRPTAWSSRWVGVLAATMLAATPLTAQQTGRVIGQVTSGETNQPLTNVQVMVQGTQIGGLTGQEGDVLLLDVPTGTHTVVAQLLGYGSEQTEVTVTAGGTAQVQFEMFTQAIDIDGVVATGTAVAAQRRELGNSVELITAADIEMAAVSSFTDVLRGRTLGASVRGLSGEAGAGSAILLRGINSLGGNNNPLIYVDGTRMQTGAIGEDLSGSRQDPTFLDNIAPGDIERVEIIKGASATTLYGTEASAGVIQIFTKSGGIGAPQWSFSTEQGVAIHGHMGPEEDETGMSLNNCSLEPGCPESNRWLNPAHHQDYQLSVRGGAEEFQYYVSGGFNSQEGSLPQQDARMANIRSNFTFHPFEDVSLRLNNMYTNRVIHWLPTGNNIGGIMFEIMRGPLGYAPFNDDSLILDRINEQTIHQFVSGANLQWTPGGGFSHRINTGLSWSMDDAYDELPYGYWQDNGGSREVDMNGSRNLTMDYAGSWYTELLSDFTSTFSWGGQVYTRHSFGLEGESETFGGPGSHLLQSGTEDFDADETRGASQSGGVFLQEQIGWANRLFVTAGMRWDTHDAFGDRLATTLDTYFTSFPKLSAAYTLSDHAFWPAWWETMRFRTAWGRSGEAPDADAAVRLWEVDGADGNNPAYIVDNIGNPDIGPEVVDEWEMGFDGSLLDGRVSYTFTYYDRVTKDGILSLDRAPSVGILESVDTNIGQWSSSGTESQLDVAVYRGDNVRFNVGGQLSIQSSKLDFLRPNDESDGPAGQDRGQEFRVGYPMPVYYDDKMMNPDEVGVWPEYDDYAVGPSYPPRDYSLSTTLTLFNNLTLDALAGGQSGHNMTAHTARRQVDYGRWWDCLPVQDQLDEVGGDITQTDLTTLEYGRCSRTDATWAAWNAPADYWKLYSASATYRVPADWLPPGTSNLVLGFKGSNLFTLTDYPGFDPSSVEGTATAVRSQINYYNLPAPRVWVLDLQVNF